jgi:hypothetical protein
MPYEKQNWQLILLSSLGPGFGAAIQQLDDAVAALTNGQIINQVVEATFNYSDTTTEPPTGAQIRFDSTTMTAVNKVWVMKTTTDSQDAGGSLLSLKAGQAIKVEDFDDSSLSATFRLAADAVDKTSYVEYPVVFVSAQGPLKTQKIKFLYMVKFDFG